MSWMTRSKEMAARAGRRWAMLEPECAAALPAYNLFIRLEKVVVLGFILKYDTIRALRAS